MTAIRASAPGKAVLLGEYAVLAGAPALVMAIDRRARVDIVVDPDRQSRVEVPQLGLAPIEFRRCSSGKIAWLSDRADQPAFGRARRVLEWLLARHAGRLAEHPGLRIRIDTGELYQQTEQGPIKLGLGSSAAMTVALAGALEALADPAPPAAIAARLADQLLGPYRAGQGGRGSGIDLAASLHGGLCRYQLAADQPRVERVALPEALKLAFVWTGQAASTADFLARHEAWCHERPAAAAAAQRTLERYCRETLARLAANDAPGVMTCINKYRRGMGKIGDSADLPVLSASLAEMAEIAECHGLACKPCGAGGGDLAVLAGIDEHALDQACRLLEARGWPRLPLGVAGHGLDLEVRPA
ncbi:MAG: mevalonate kinase [Wenzhouxiangella sp.]